MTEAMTTSESPQATTQESNASQVLDGKENVSPVPVVQSNNNSSPNQGTSDVQKSFIETLAEDLRKEKSLSTFKTADDLAKSYLNQSKLIGKKVTEMTPEELKQINIKMGAPETPEGYEFEKSPTEDPNLVSWFKGTAHELGLSKQDAAKLATKWNENMAAAQKYQESQQILQNENDMKELKREFGAAYDERVDLANKAVSKFGGQALVEVLAKHGLQSNPVLVKVFAEAGKLLSEGTIQASNDKGQFGMTPAEARSKVLELKSDEGFQKRFNSTNVNIRTEAFKQLEDLYKIANINRR